MVMLEGGMGYNNSESKFFTVPPHTSLFTAGTIFERPAIIDFEKKYLILQPLLKGL